MSLMGVGLGSIYLSNYVRFGRSPAAYPMAVTATNVCGALLIGLLLDALAGYHLRSLFAALKRQRLGQPLQPGEAEAEAVRAMRFPERAALLLMGLSVLLIIGHRAISNRGALLEMLLAPGVRSNLLVSMVSDLARTLLLALLLFTISRQVLRPAVAAFRLRRVPGEHRLPIGLRLAGVVLATGVFITTQFASVSGGIPTGRVLWIYLPPLLLTAVVAYLIAIDIGSDLDAIGGRLRLLAQGVRPALFDRFAVTERDEVGDLVAAINALQDRVEREFQEVERDMEAARSVQMGLLPRTWRLPPGWQLTARLHPAREVGGDFYDVIDLGGGRLGLAVGDAAGKGLPAALLMASTVSLLRTHATLHDRPGSVLAAVNRLLCASLPPMAFVTTAYAIVDTVRGEVCVASAGHLPPVIGGREMAVLPALPLGVEPDSQFEEQVWPLGPGEPLLIYSDGLIEGSDFPGSVRAPGWMEALTDPLQTAETVVRRLMEPLRTRIEQGTLQDDVTALMLIPPAQLSLELPSRDGAELEAAEAAGRFARAHGPAGRADDVATAVGEACLNAVTHGNGLEAELPVQIHLTAGPTWLEAVVADGGGLFSLEHSPPDLAAQMAGDGPIRGWGLHLVRALADEVTVEPLAAGKQVRMRFGGESHV
jgi:serine phosphatase RsbU (regulator of sigma subunit)/anti-sigma regulatory factor (Ser/Thr protein kinase)